MPPEYCQQSALSGPHYTHLTILYRYIPHQQEIDKLLKNFSTKLLHIYNLILHAVNQTKEYQHPFRFQVIYLYIVQINYHHVVYVKEQRSYHSHQTLSP